MSKLIPVGDWLIDPDEVTGIGLSWSKEEELRVCFEIVIDGCVIEIRGSKEEMKRARLKLMEVKGIEL
jgi:hypothetical protein